MVLHKNHLSCLRAWVFILFIALFSKVCERMRVLGFYYCVRQELWSLYLRTIHRVMKNQSSVVQSKNVCGLVDFTFEKRVFGVMP